MAKYKPGVKFVIEIDEILEGEYAYDTPYMINTGENSYLMLTEEYLDSLKCIAHDDTNYNLGYIDGVKAENERIRDLLFPFEED